jgi:hypothetical protein
MQMVKNSIFAATPVKVGPEKTISGCYLWRICRTEFISIDSNTKKILDLKMIMYKQDFFKWNKLLNENLKVASRIVVYTDKTDIDDAKKRQTGYSGIPEADDSPIDPYQIKFMDSIKFLSKDTLSR